MTRVFNTPRQNSIYRADKGKKRTQEAARLADSLGSGGPIAKRHKSSEPGLPLSKENLKRLVKSTPRSGSSKFPSKSSTTSSKRSCPTDPEGASLSSSASSPAYSAKDPGFEKGLGSLNVKSTRFRIEPDAEEVEKLLNMMERERDSPPPDSAVFYRTLSFAESENETTVTTDITPLLMPRQHILRDNDKTKDLLYRLDKVWQGWGSAKPGILPTPRPDFGITFKESAFTPDEQNHMISPYKDGAGFHPVLI